ncbi:MAG: oxidoreductase, partial [Actinomycetota bacterium]
MSFRALVVDPTAQPTASVLECDDETLVGDVLLRVEYSSCNFKDAMVIQPGNRIARRSPLIAGVDLAGTVLDPGSSSRSI